MNKSDSERIATVLEKTRYQPASKINEADLIVVNMCSVRQSAVDRVFGLLPKLRELKTTNHKLQTILTGCILKKDKNKLSKIFDLVLDIRTLPRFARQNLDLLRYKHKNLEFNYLPKWPKILDSKNKKTISGKELIKATNYLKIQSKYSNKFSALVPIMTGCNNFCSYCVVPYVRGREISRPAEEIICEIKNLVKRGYKEIWLLGQNVNSYSAIPFPQLLKKINKIPGKFWIRFTSSHPRDFSDELIEAMAGCKKVTEYLNLPIQAGDNKILKQMNRRYTVKYYKNLVKKIRKKIPNIALSTDIIVGFPGETKKQFENTAKLFKEIEYDMAYINKFSLRTGTKAAKLKDNISPKEKDRRDKILTEVLKQTALEKNKKYIGKTVEVLVNKTEKGFLFGKTRTYKTVKVESKKKLLGQFVKVKIIDALPWGLKGEFKKTT